MDYFLCIIPYIKYIKLIIYNRMTDTWSGLIHIVFFTKTDDVFMMWTTTRDVFLLKPGVWRQHKSVFLQGCDLCCKTVILLYYFVTLVPLWCWLASSQWQYVEQPEEVSVVQVFGFCETFQLTSRQWSSLCVKLC